MFVSTYKVSTTASVVILHLSTRSPSINSSRFQHFCNLNETCLRQLLETCCKYFISDDAIPPGHPLRRGDWSSLDDETKANEFAKFQLVESGQHFEKGPGLVKKMKMGYLPLLTADTRSKSSRLQPTLRTGADWNSSVRTKAPSASL